MRRQLIFVAAASAACLALASCGSSGSTSPTSGPTGPASTVAAATGSSDQAGSAGSTAGASATTGAPGASDAPGAPGGTVTTRLNADAGTLDPALSTVGGQVIDTYLYDPLVNIDLSGKVVSGIAEKWSVKPDSATFTLRDDVTCTDGHVITATDVKANYDYLKDPKTHATWIVSNMSTTDYTVTADDATRTVTIKLPKPYGDLISGISAVGIVCPGGLKDPASLTAGSDGTGPFVVDTATPDVQYTIKARPGYKWGPDGQTNAAAGFPSEVVWKVVKDDSTAVNMFIRGELNLLPMGGNEATRLTKDPSVTKTDTVASTGSFMVYNQLPGRLLAGDKAVREALAKSTNRQDLVQVATGGLGEITNTLVNQQPRTCDDSAAASSVPTYDVEAAKKLLDDDGWTVGAGGVREKDGKKLTLILLANDASKPVWEYLQQVWSTQLGVDAQLVSLDNNSSTDRLLKGGDWDVSLIRIATTLHTSWTQFLLGPQPPDGLNLGSGNKTYAELATKAQATPGQAGCDLWVQAEESAFSSLDLFPMYVPKGQWFAHNVEFTPVWDEGLLPLSLRTTG
ncbi:ABC transporter substrate-binding protein [Nakamurella lactea]|uniref:ABC transporter substrate-binding protein n=1 Tax=Nakamurella lactea TaxID=459515 RepID=UPI0003FA8EC0|nr:ABC transporter substrate-binding protein [Nakamurella lactea]